MEKYSVLMSLYKKENVQFLRLALDSMINQSIQPDEIVLVEDGPLTKELYDEVNKYKEKYPLLIKSVVNETNLGLGISLYNGLKVCKNELVARMDTDDISDLERCEKQLKYMVEHNEVAVVGGQIEEFIDNINNIVGKREVPTENEHINEYIKKRCPFNHMTVMFRKKDIEEVGSYKDWFWNEDYYLWIRLYLAGKKLGNLKDTLVKVRVGREMYQRRGGFEYFRSEYLLQKYMLDHRVIGRVRFVINVCERFIVQLLLPNKIRGIVFRIFARKKGV